MASSSSLLVSSSSTSTSTSTSTYTSTSILVALTRHLAHAVSSAVEGGLTSSSTSSGTSESSASASTESWVSAAPVSFHATIPPSITSTSTTSSFPSGETQYELYMDLVLGTAFLITALVAAKRMSFSQRQPSSSQQQQQSSSGGGGGPETAVVTAFYSLILATSILRAIWFYVPSSVWQPDSYTPVAVYAFEDDDSSTSTHSTSASTSSATTTSHSTIIKKTSWIGVAMSEIVVTAGSLTLFSIFILILVYWADILKKYFQPGSRRSLPMVTFLGLVSTLVVLELLNIIGFLLRFYSTEGMILYNAVLLAIVSIICVAEITVFSHRFRTVLKTLGAINQVSTDSQVRRIVWITVTGNLFFLTRAILECTFAGLLLVYYRKYGTVDRAFQHVWWDVYVAIKYWSEVTILGLMLYILQSRFTAGGGGGGNAATPTTRAGPRGGGAGGRGTAVGDTSSGGMYQKVPDAELRV